MRFLTLLYTLLIRFGVVLAPIVLLLIRLAWGWELFESGHGHLQNVDVMIAKFTGWGIPHPRVNFYISAYTEMIGGVLIMLGLASRLVSIPLFINFCVAYLTASRMTVTGFFHNNPSNFIDDTAFPFLMMSLTILAFGPGIISLDGILSLLLFNKPKSSAPA
jgi:putative oxidoreductase